MWGGGGGADSPRGDFEPEEHETSGVFENFVWEKFDVVG